MRFNDAVFGIVLILFALAEIAYAQTFPSLHGQAYGPDLFPVVIGLGMIACGVLLIASGLAGRAATPMVQIGEWASDRRQVLTFVLVILALLFYILAADWLGFVPVSLIILITLFRRFGVGWLPSLAAAVATTLAIQALFARFLLVPLPWGLLQPVAW
jgi:putative tricarboxylic transport membrane protein